MRLALIAPIVHRIPPTHYGPREALVASLCDALVTHGYDVTLFASGDSTTTGKLAAACPVPVTAAPHGDPSLWETVHAALLGEQAAHFDLIHNHCDWLPLAYRRFLHTPMLTTLYDTPAPQITPFLQHYTERHYYVATSQAGQSPDLQYTAMVYPGVDVMTLPYSDTPGTYVVWCGRLHPDTHVTTAIDIARRFDKPLMLVGPIADQRYFDTEVAPQLQAPQVTYAGEVTTAACHKLLAEAYALLVPKRNDDTCSLSVLEAMATGTPVVTFATGAMPELVCDGTTGYVVADVNEAVARLAQVDRLRRQDCRQWVQERFSLTRMVERYVALYEQVLAQEKSRAHHATPPWGHWEVLLDEPAYKVKRITVRSDKRLSYQKHFRREEHWTIVQGQALVTLDGQQMLLDAGRTIAIPRQAAHRIANPGPQDLVFIEVQCGTYFGEDDIIRLEDDYGRAGTV